MYGVLIFRSNAKTSHSKLRQSGVPYTGTPGTRVPVIVAGTMLNWLGNPGLYAGPGEKKVGYGKWPRAISCEIASKNTPKPALTTVLPFPVTSQDALTRGAKSFLSGS